MIDTITVLVLYIYIYRFQNLLKPTMISCPTRKCGSTGYMGVPQDATVLGSQWAIVDPEPSTEWVTNCWPTVRLSFGPEIGDHLHSPWLELEDLMFIDLCPHPHCPHPHQSSVRDVCEVLLLLFYYAFVPGFGHKGGPRPGACFRTRHRLRTLRAGSAFGQDHQGIDSWAAFEPRTDEMVTGWFWMVD